MSLGDAWTEATPGSASKLNKVTIISGTGTYIAGLAKTQHGLFIVTTSTGGLIGDHVYLCNAAGDALIDLSDINEHTHADNLTGGGLVDILRSNINVLDSGMQFITNPDVAKWVEANDGTASVTNDTNGTTFERSVKLDTGATSGSTANIKQFSLEVDMSKRSWFKTMTQLQTASSLALKVGIGVENLANADDNARKYGYSLCTSVNNNYFSMSATGAARSASDTGTAMDANRTSFRCEHYPDLGTPKVDLYINEGTVFTKTSNIPTTYANDDPSCDNIFRVSLKNNTAASRTMLVYGVRFCYTTSSKWDEQ